MRTSAGAFPRAMTALLGAAGALLASAPAVAQEGSGTAATTTSGEAAWTTDAEGRRFRVGFDPGSRWLLGGGYATGLAADGGWAGPAAGMAETGLQYRHVVEDLEEETAWKLSHEFLAVRAWLGDLGTAPVPRLDATLYRSAYLRWQRQGFLTLPTTTPQRVPFPFNIGLDVAAGRFETVPEETGLAARLEILHAHFLLDAWRSRVPGRFAQFGLGFGYDLWLAGRFDADEPLGTEHLVSPGADFVAGVRTETRDGRHAVEAHGSCGGWWSNVRGWGLRAQAAASYELVWLAINDQPLSAYVEAAYRYEPFLDDAGAAHEFRATAGLRLGITLSE